MHCFYDPNHHLHSPEYEFFRGEKVPCFESPQRADFVLTALQQAKHSIATPTADSQSILLQVHSPRYIDFLRSAWSRWIALDAKNNHLQPFPSVWPIRSLRSDQQPANFIAQLGLYSMDNGTPLDSGSWQVAKTAADAAFEAASLVASGAHRAVLCATRPPGHHAGSDFMGGYCFINNAAVAAQTFRQQGVNKVAIVDVDFHHGNGTQAIFYERSDVFYGSVHGDPRTQYPFYLGYADETGAGQGIGCNLNIPLPVQSDSATWFAALAHITAATEQFGAQALVISLGLDTFIDDPHSQFKLTTQDFYELGRKIARYQLPTVFILEGGYAASALGTNVCEVLAGFETAAVRQLKNW